MSGAGRAADIPDGHILIGRIVGTHGVKGGLKVDVLTDFPQRFTPGNLLFVGQVPRQILGVLWHKGQARIQLEGIASMEDAEALKWTPLSVPEAELPDLAEDEFMVEDLIGMTVVEVDGSQIGSVTDILHMPAHDVIVVGEVMIPAVSEFIRDIDFDHDRITVALIEGMKPGENPEVVQ